MIKQICILTKSYKHGGYCVAGIDINTKEWIRLVNSDNPNAYTEKDKLPVITKSTLEYSVFKPVYNEGAAKVRTVTAKESNYFNVLQSIAETFEQWLVIDIERETDGSIKPNGKKIHFRNYRGGNNYACFRYGVNLKDIQRTKSSKNIVTKLIVKQNSNELAENGFCTIQRAGANPTGENYIYDFQYYQNTGIMSADEYLTTNYYLNDAQGPDHSLWEGGIVVDNDEYNINGYFPRLKKINDSILPINEEIIGLQADLVKRKAELEVAEATYEAAISGIEQTEEDFRALTGVSPKEAQSGEIESIDVVEITSQDGWSVVDTDSIIKNTQSISVTLKVDKTYVEEYCEVIADSETEVKELTSGAKEVTKKAPWTGLYIQNDWEDEQLHDEKDGDVYRTYKLTYELEWTKGTLKNIGCHNSWFATSDFCITITDENGEEIGKSSDSICYPKEDKAFQMNTKYLVTIEATRNPGPPEPQFSKDLWIQPNRGETDGSTEVTCKISKIKLYKQLTSGETAKSYDRTAHIRINAKIKLERIDTPVERTFETSCAFPADQTSVVATQPVSVIDATRSDVQKYLTEYTTYFEKLESSSLEKASLTPIIANKENDIKEKEAYRKQLFEYKTELNKLFFKRYSRFIQEGTWINEEYADDEKYYADALSVLYNSCYPQVAYSINVLELSAQPGYELFSFEPGEKTWAIDPEFFGEDYREEVIITELSEMLDDPSKNNVKVQNFKNQFQDLFQKITATVQQTQYNVGSYEKGAALVEASAAKKSEFIINAINAAQTYLNAGQTVKSGADGITITDDSNAKRQLRLVGGAILFSAEDPETKETRWRTGLTNEGISADLIRAGKIDTGEIQIMAGDQAAFRWDVYGISAYDAPWVDGGGVSTVGNVNTNKFVRFDKHGIYGIDGTANGATWHPTGLDAKYKYKENPALAEIDDKATFALTWQGLKVTGDNAATRIGKYTSDGKTAMIKVSKGTIDTFVVDDLGNVFVRGDLQIGNGVPVENVLAQMGRNLLVNTGGSGIIQTKDKSGVRVSGGELNTVDGVSTFDISATSGEVYYRFCPPVADKMYIFEAGENYVLSGKIKISTTSGSLKSISARHEYNTGSNWADAGSTTILSNDSSEWVSFSAPFSVNDDATGFYTSIQVYYENTFTGKLELKELKLEKGLLATDWTPAPEDSFDVNDTYSWKFDQKNGMMMWSGTQSDSNLVFKIDKDDSGAGRLWMNGNGVFSGTIYATDGEFTGTIYAKAGGTIGGWNIGEQKLYHNLPTFSTHIGGKQGFYLGKEGLRFTSSDSGGQYDKDITEWYVDSVNGAMYLGVANSFENIWNNNSTYEKLNTNLSIDKDGIIYYLTDSDNHAYFGSALTPTELILGADAGELGLSSPGLGVIVGTEILKIQPIIPTSGREEGQIFSRYYTDRSSTQRSIMKWNNSGQVSFPQGIYDKDNEGLVFHLSFPASGGSTQPVELVFTGQKIMLTIGPHPTTGLVSVYEKSWIALLNKIQEDYQ